MALLLVATAWVGLSVYDQYEAKRLQLKALVQTAAERRGRQKQFEEKKRILLQVQRFMDKARSLGLEPQGWSVYAVNIEEPLPFAEMEQILNQCTNSAAAYYLPASLHIKAIAANQTSSVKAKPPVSSRADVAVTLKGKFLAKPE
jgi:hypothetical protein